MFHIKVWRTKLILYTPDVTRTPSRTTPQFLTLPSESIFYDSVYLEQKKNVGQKERHKKNCIFFTIRIVYREPNPQ